ncbi:MAG: hypothetical protein K0Q51_900, partial [Rickettsiaceae bacterium]|nr:hypothetical protein [Rickettsiaceae bacterium]
NKVQKYKKNKLKKVSSEEAEKLDKFIELGLHDEINIPGHLPEHIPGHIQDEHVVS